MPAACHALEPRSTNAVEEDEVRPFTSHLLFSHRLTLPSTTPSIPH